MSGGSSTDTQTLAARARELAAGWQGRVPQLPYMLRALADALDAKDAVIATGRRLASTLADALESVTAERDALRAVIEDAPHQEWCGDVVDAGPVDERGCNCWVSRALAVGHGEASWDTARLDSTLNQIARYAAAIAEQVRADEASEDTAVLADAIESLADGLVADRRKAEQ